MDPWPFDLPGDPDYPVYLRGQAEEVLPGVLSPMMSTLGAPIVERAWRIHFVDTLPVIDEPRNPHTCFPVFGGRSYLNLSVSARAGALQLGVRAEDFAAQFAAGDEFMQSAVVSLEGDDVRAARMQAVIGDLLENLPEAMLAEDRDAALARRVEGRARRPAMSADELLARIHELAPQASQTLSRVMLIGTLSAICFSNLDTGLGAVYGDGAADLVRDLLSGIGNVESALPARQLVALGALEGAEYRRALEQFLADVGYRGANEFEIASLSWELVPEAVNRMVDAARTAPAKPHAEVRAAEARAKLDADGISQKWPDFESWLARTAFYVGSRERAKATFVIVYNEIRLDLIEIGRRLVADGRLAAPEDVFLLGIDELELAVRGGEAVDTAALTERVRRMAELGTLVPPPMVEVGRVPPLDQWARTEVAGTPSLIELHGVPGSPGTARGRARVVRDPYEDTPPQPGEILVAPFTDPGWTLMFMAAEAVIVEVGGMLSHAVVVARELAIPAVASVAGCCTELRTGDLIEVDGAAGVVRVIERGASTP